MCKPFVLFRWNPPVASTYCFLSHPLRVPPVTFRQVLLYAAAFFTDRFIFHLSGRGQMSNHAPPLADWLVCCQTRSLILSWCIIENYVHFGERTIYNVYTPLVSVRKEEAERLLLLFSTAVILLQQDYTAIEQDTTSLWKVNILNYYNWQWSSKVYVVVM